MNVHIIHGLRYVSGTLIESIDKVHWVSQRGFAQKMRFQAAANGLLTYKGLLLADASHCACPNCRGLRKTAALIDHLAKPNCGGRLI